MLDFWMSFASSDATRPRIDGRRPLVASKQNSGSMVGTLVLGRFSSRVALPCHLILHHLVGIRDIDGDEFCFRRAK